MTRPLLCVTVAGETMTELRARRDAVQDADLVEVRLDSVRDPDAAGALAGRRGPVIVTCRPRWEGGAFDGSEEERRRLLAQALALGAEYVDIEWGAGFDDLIGQRHGRNVLLSMHDMRGVPADLAERVRAMLAVGAQVVKVAVFARRLCDALPLLNLAPPESGEERLVTVAMGPSGVASRILAARFGSFWTYAGENAAPGQISPARLLREFRFRRLSATTDVYGVVGRPLTHSLSPAMHNAAFEAAGCDAVYVPFEAADADDFVGFAHALGVRGASVTAPFKRGLADLADELDEVSRRAGALNTVRLEGGHLLGMNTDVAGFLQPLKGRDLRDWRVAILGAGGAARAVAVALASVGAQVRVYARDHRRAVEVAGLVGGSGHALPPPPGSWDMLVNTTPIGTFPGTEDTPLPAGDLGGRLVYDLVYNPLRTRLLREAEAAGCETIGGLDMLVEQARLQFEWWTGCCVPAPVFRDAAMKRLRIDQAGTVGE